MNYLRNMEGVEVVKRKRRKVSIHLEIDQTILLGFQNRIQEAHKHQEENKKQSKGKSKYPLGIIVKTLNILMVKIGTQHKRGILGLMGAHMITNMVGIKTVTNMAGIKTRMNMVGIKDIRVIDQSMMGIGI